MSELLESPAVILSAASLAAAFAVMVYALLCWRQRNMQYFAYLAVAVVLNGLGYFLEVTATTVEAATIACKISFVGTPLIGLLIFLFSLDYSEHIYLGRKAKIVCAAFAPVFTLAAFLYPWIPVFFRDLTLHTEGATSQLLVTPAPLYYLCIIYIGLFAVLASINLTVGFFRAKRYEGAIIFLIAVFVPLFALFYRMIFGFVLIDGWSPERVSLAASMVLLAVYLARYKQAEWQSTGRELVVQEMEDAFILLDNKDTVIDHNFSAETYFPVLKNTRRHQTLGGLWEFPADNYRVCGTHQMDMELNGRTVNLKISTSPLEAGGKRTGTLIIINDDTVNNQMLHELKRLARRDELTGLCNRATFFQDATGSFDLAHRQKENMGCALMIDIDFFKNVNDTYGHATGDDVLRCLGNLLLTRFRRTDICGRYGGEELSVWMPATSLDGAIQVAEEIRAAVEEKTFMHEGTAFNITISIGIACMKRSRPDDFYDLIKMADYALYEAKHTGRNRVCVYNGHVVDAEDRRVLPQAFKRRS